MRWLRRASQKGSIQRRREPGSKKLPLFMLMGKKSVKLPAFGEIFLLGGKEAVAKALYTY